jgi:hypothetical protein
MIEGGKAGAVQMPLGLIAQHAVYRVFIKSCPGFKLVKKGQKQI